MSIDFTTWAYHIQLAKDKTPSIFTDSSNLDFISNELHMDTYSKSNPTFQDQAGS